MGDYDFLSGLDLGDLGGGIAGGANSTALPTDFSGMNFDIPNFTVPQFGAGVMGGVQIPNLPQNYPSIESGSSITAPAGIFTGVNPVTPPSFAPSLPLGAGVTLDPNGAPQPPKPWYADILKPAQTGLQAATGLAGLGVSGLGIKASLDAARNAREQAGIQRGFQRNQQQLQQTQARSIAPLQQFGTNQLQQASAGQVDPAIQAYIDQWAQAEKAKMQQQFAQMGLTNSPMFQSAMGQIDKQALAMKSSVIGQDKQTAIRALQGAMGGTVGAMGGANAGAMVANQEQNQLDNLIRSSQQALAELNAMAK